MPSPDTTGVRSPPPTTHPLADIDPLQPSARDISVSTHPQHSQDIFDPYTASLLRATRPSADAHSLTSSTRTKDRERTGKQPAEAAAVQNKKTKEEAALAKWRKWVIEHPVHAPPLAASASTSGRSSSPGQKIPLVTLNTFTLRTYRPSDDDVQRTHSSRNGHFLYHPSDTEGSTSSPVTSLNVASPNVTVSPMSSSRFDSLENEVFNTDSVLALRDVELAVDEEILERTQRAQATSPHFVSNRSRLYETLNPFGDITHRLSSRRVRPIALELIQALGHLVDAVWLSTYPDRPCPWIIGLDESPIQSSIKHLIMTYRTPTDAYQTGVGWKSPMITAVQEGKRTGYVPTTIADSYIQFCENEVAYAIGDVDQVVGVSKGAGYIFGRALRAGEYGAPVRTNVLGANGEGGGMTRLLNDLEEAIWGDAPPRVTDLAYELPDDFDPYAIPDESELIIAAAAAGGGSGHLTANSSSLADLFRGEASASASAGAGANANGYAILASRRQSSQETGETYDSLPDFDITSSLPDDITRISTPVEIVKNKLSGGLLPGIEDIRGAEGMTLEELGKKRHEEWLANRAAMGG
ncbi:hypothetical protein I305_01704 [Cryptococcus gattii E566]|uniref:Uncharacterized protein n=2 Tax=Cryptococcus gattii TaxID=37769 RepID=E6R5Y5_CRYGW|nr:uncharacterized protein CGB_D3270W [Cryptococcus gattii WM276]ADV21692.1 hypothetical protein CNBD5260 [Cryptococcus gattii WM276]KIR80598.1 hypothetical protein I306_02052 [Cryptococcus gattii EJB2]KIY35456.1 hypothetical protein I305_01704 [Cryptococcus gattii E566]KJE04304.1 hypothetical protein I311_01785 [Cryptococcus gattii NT-10]